MKQSKNVTKNNMLLGLAICIAISSIVVGCDSSCESPEERDTKPVVTITAHSGDIKNTTDVATVKVQKTEGGPLALGDAVLNFGGDYQKFVKEGSTSPLSQTMKLSEFLGKDEEEGIEDQEHLLKIKVSPTANEDAKLQLSVGSNEDSSAYAAKMDVVNYKHTPAAPTTTTIQVTSSEVAGGKATWASGDKLTVTLTKSGTLAINQGDVWVQFGGAAVDKFDNGGTTLDTTAVQLNKLIAGGSETAAVPATCTIQLTKNATAVGDGETLTISVGNSSATPASYQPAKQVMKWQEKQEKYAVGAPADVVAITFGEKGNVVFKNNSNCPLDPSQLTMNFSGDVDFFSICSGAAEVNLKAGTGVALANASSSVGVGADFSKIVFSANSHALATLAHSVLDSKIGAITQALIAGFENINHRDIPCTALNVESKAKVIFDNSVGLISDPVNKLIFDEICALLNDNSTTTLNAPPNEATKEQERAAGKENKTRIISTISSVADAGSSAKKNQVCLNLLKKPEVQSLITEEKELKVRIVKGTQEVLAETTILKWKMA